MTMIGSLFSGYGGLDLAVESVCPGDLAWVCDIDPGACRILDHRYPSVPNLGDISAVDWTTIPPVDILTGGFPCQDVSMAGNRRGMRSDTRTGLWTVMADAIDHLRPSLVIAENVRGLLSAEADSDVESCPWCLGVGADEPSLRALGAVLADLAGLGYDAAWHGLRAADVGAPHGRFRIFVLAWPADPASIGPERGSIGSRSGRSGSADGSGFAAADAGGQRYQEHERIERTTEFSRSGRDLASSADAAGIQRVEGAPGADPTGREPNGPARSGRIGGVVSDTDLFVERVGLHACGRESDTSGCADGCPPGGCGEACGGGPGDADGGATVADTDGVGARGRSGEREAGESAAGEDRTNESVADPEGIEQRESAIPGVRTEPGESDPGTSEIRWGRYAASVRRWEQRVGRPAPAPTEPFRGLQRLSPPFVEWMMGLPAGWVTEVPGLGRNAQIKALGNGVVPQQAAAALRVLLHWRSLAVTEDILEPADLEPADMTGW